MNTKKFITLTAALVFTLVTVSFAQPAVPIPQEPAAQTHFAGVGVMLFQSTTNAPIKIARVMPDSPAWNSRIKPDSILASINGDSTANLTMKHCVELIRGEAGTQVTLGLVDPRTKETNNFTLTRTLLSVPPAKTAKP